MATPIPSAATWQCTTGRRHSRATTACRTASRSSPTRPVRRPEAVRRVPVVRAMARGRSRGVRSSRDGLSRLRRVRGRSDCESWNDAPERGSVAPRRSHRQIGQSTGRPWWEAMRDEGRRVTAVSSRTSHKGVVVNGTGGVWCVRTESGETLDASLRGRLKKERHDMLKLTVGDDVVVERDGAHGWAISEILERRSQLARRMPGAGRGERIVAAKRGPGGGRLRGRESRAHCAHARPLSGDRRGKRSRGAGRDQQDRAGGSRGDRAAIQRLRACRLPRALHQRKEARRAR